MRDIRRGYWKDVQEMPTFIIDCFRCRAKVAAEEIGQVTQQWFDRDNADYGGDITRLGKCPNCRAALVGVSLQTGLEGFDSEDDTWGDFVRVYPEPSKVFQSSKIPQAVLISLNEADKALQVGAYIAACVMLGRAIEALCRDKIEQNSEPKRRFMLGAGLGKLKEAGVIDERIFNWGKQLQNFRNLAAHADETKIDRQDAEDLQSFAVAMVDYVYDLADRYETFKERVAKHELIHR
jgi:hypothetical protein